VGEASAVCSTMESKYRYRGGARKCPMCGKEAIKKSKFPPRNQPNAQPGYYCFAKIGGCGAEFAADDKDIIGQSEAKTENPDIADQYNTVKQIAQKRAFLSAIKTATASSELFTIDVGDPENEGQQDHDDAHRPVEPRHEADAGDRRNAGRQAQSGEENQDDRPPGTTAAPQTPWQEMMEAFVKYMGIGAKDWKSINHMIKWFCQDLDAEKCYKNPDDAQRIVSAIRQKNCEELGMPLEDMPNAAGLLQTAGTP